MLTTPFCLLRSAPAGLLAPLTEQHCSINTSAGSNKTPNSDIRLINFVDAAPASALPVATVADDVAGAKKTAEMVGSAAHSAERAHLRDCSSSAMKLIKVALLPLPSDGDVLFVVKIDVAVIVGAFVASPIVLAAILVGEGRPAVLTVARRLTLQRLHKRRVLALPLR